MWVSDRIAQLEISGRQHRAGTFSTRVLRRLEALLPNDIQHSAETGCGKSTIMFSNVSRQHTVFCIDDREYGDDSSINYFEQCPLTRRDRISLVLGPTQLTLPRFGEFKPYDVVLIDGPHGYPFPELEYFYFYPHLKRDGLLILDDVHIPTIGRLGDFLAEDAMFELVELVKTTAVFRRTSAPMFDPQGDGWWLQDFNRRRIPKRFPGMEPLALRDLKARRPFGERFDAEVGPPSGSPAGMSAPRKIWDKARTLAIRVGRRIWRR